MNEHQQNCGENDVAGKVQNTLEDVLMISVPARILSSVVDMASSHVEDIESGLKDGTYDPSENRDLPQKQAATNEVHRLYREAMLAESARLREECADRKVVEKYFRVNYYVPNATGSDGFEDGHDFFCKATSENEAAKKLEADVPNAAGLTFEEIGEEDVLTAHGINVYESNDVPGNWGFTGCDSDCYESEADATSAALESAHVTRKVVENALIRLTFDVEYMPNGSSIEQLKANLEDVARLAVNEGLLTGGTEAEVEDYKFEIVANPSVPQDVGATLFWRELSESVETLTELADQHGPRTLADLMYLQNAILSGGFIDHYPGESSALEIVKALPSADRWLQFVKVEEPENENESPAPGM